MPAADQRSTAAGPRRRHRIRRLLSSLALLTLASCSSAPLSSCLSGASVAGSAQPSTPPPEPRGRPLAASSDAMVGIDGSGSMLGFLGSGSDEWLSMLQALKLAITAQSLQPRMFRVGGSSASRLTSLDPARDRCFFSGCNGLAPVSSSLHTLWTLPARPGTLPMRLMLSDLEVNDNDVNDLVAAVRTDVGKGATIGVLGVKLPFNGTIYDSQGRTIHVGRARRPLYLLASGEAPRVRQLLDAVRENLSLRGVPTQDLQISLLGDPGQTTLLARSSQGDPPGSVNIGVPVAVGTTVYEPGSHPDVQLLKLLPDNRGVRISSAAIVPTAGTIAPPGLISLSPLGAAPASSNGISLRSLEVSGTSLSADLRIDPGVTATAVRLTLPAGSLPQEWWLLWNRSNARSPQARDQTDGLLLAMTKLGQALSPAGAPPAAVFCVALSRGEEASPQGQGGAIVAVLVALLVLGLLGALVVQQIRQAQEDSEEGGEDG